MKSIDYLFDGWDEIRKKLLSRPLMLFLDYDGTLTPIVEKPEWAILSPAMKKILEELHHNKEVTVAIVSGRSLEQLKERIGIPSLFYVGNHGFEIEGPGFHYTHPGALETEQAMRLIATKLEKALGDIPGANLENKTLTLSLHYREVPKNQIEHLKSHFFTILAPFVEANQVHFTEGKKVLEVRPMLEWNKGTAVSWLYARKLAANPSSEKIFPIYLGDDKTDESALKAVQDEGLGIKVTEAQIETHARFYLKNSEDVYDFLKRIQALKKNP